MSVSFAKAWVAEVRKHGIRVDLLDGCFSRGNGQTSDYEGPLEHHTAGGFDRGFSTLVNGRPDLDGPLCNVCTWSDGHKTLIAAHPANHAGASGGRGTAPLPVTSLFNKRVWGDEIMYPGTVPMTDAQYRSALIGAGVTCELLGKPFSYAKFHAETSITGKWDPGYAPGKTYSATAFRAAIPGALKGDDDMSEAQFNALKNAIEDSHQDLASRLANAERRVHERIAATKERDNLTEDEFKAKIDQILAELNEAGQS